MNCVGQKAPLSVPVMDNMIPEGPDNPEQIPAGGTMVSGSVSFTLKR